MPRRSKQELARELLKTLVDGGVEFFVTGGVAAHAHGLRKKINDLDIVYRRSRENFRKIADTLRPLNPYPRGLDPGQAVPWNASVINDGYSFLISTTLGDLDLIAELSGDGTWRALRNSTSRMRALGIECNVLNLKPLAYHIRESGRPKDIRLAERLEALDRRLARDACAINASP